MKCKLILSLVACGASLALCPVLHAQDATSSPSPTTTGSGGGFGRGGGGRGMNVDTMLQRLTDALTLTTDQQTQIKPILQTEVTTIQTIRANTSLAQTDRRSQMMDARNTANTAITAILTPDQQAKFTQYQQQQRNRRGGGGGGGGAGGGGGGAAPASSP
jgi:Spy/CpxP family protein refolding chaperone